MYRSLLRFAPSLAPLLLLVALSTIARPGLADTVAAGPPPPPGVCAEGISGEDAQRIFEALQKAKADDGCVLEGAHTEGSHVNVLWKKGGTLQEGVVVSPTSCVQAPTTRGKVLSTVVPPSTAKACPAGVKALSAIVTGDGFVAHAAPPPPPPPAPPGPTPDATSRAPEPPIQARSLRPVLFAALALAFAGAAFVALRWLRSKRGAEALGALRERIRSGAIAFWAWVRRRTPRNPSRAGWGAAILLGPHLVLGTWLLVVPDHLDFTAAQVVTLTHVGLALISIPAAVLWVVLHARGMRASRPRAPLGEKAVRWILAGAAIVAAATGLAALRGGDIASTATIHAACGVVVAIPLAAHLWIASRKWPALGAVGLLLAATAGAEAARRWLPPAPAEAVVPAFAYETRPENLYEPAENCGECHVQDYQDWRRSVHARTLEMSTVQESMERARDLLGEDLHHIGQILTERDSDRPVSAALIFGACGSCHAPVSFYGNGKPSLPRPKGVTSEGTGCSFCHTLREVRVSNTGPSFLEAPRGARPALPADPSDPTSPAAMPAGPRPTPGELSREDIFGVMSRAPLFVSAPETVRRYLGQGSKNRFAHAISNWLIRWRPQVHARDYHSPVLDDSRGCLPCHSLGMDSPDVPHMTYYGWEHSSYKTNDPKTTVECQDCHMVRRMTGEPVNEWASMVPWGPPRPHARSHLFLGGNVRMAETLGDPKLAVEEHELNAQAAKVAVSRVAREGDVVNVTVSVQTELIGHYFPALETKLRYGWVELQALDAAGKVLGHTPAPRDSDDFGCASPLIMASVVDPKPDNERLVAPRSAREFKGHIKVPAGAEIDRIVADLHVFVDPQPIATATWSQHGKP